MDPTERGEERGENEREKVIIQKLNGKPIQGLIVFGMEGKLLENFSCIHEKLAA